MQTSRCTNIEIAIFYTFEYIDAVHRFYVRGYTPSNEI